MFNMLYLYSYCNVSFQQRPELPPPMYVVGMNLSEPHHMICRLEMVSCVKSIQSEMETIVACVVIYNLWNMILLSNKCEQKR